MNITEIDKQLELLSLKNRLLITFKYYLINIQQANLSCLDRIFILLKDKYSKTEDYNFIENIRCSIQKCLNNLQDIIYNISPYVYNYNNELLMRDLLKCIDTGFNYKLEVQHDKITKLIVENTDITLQQNISLERIDENINNLNN